MFYANDVATNDAVHSKQGRRGDHRPGQVSSADVEFAGLPSGEGFTFGRTRAVFDFDVFNLLNSGTVLGRQYDVQASNFNAITEIMNPRIARFGVRFTF